MSSSLLVAFTGSVLPAFLCLLYVVYVLISRVRSLSFDDDAISRRARGESPPQIPYSMLLTMAYRAQSSCTGHLLHMDTAIAALLSLIVSGKNNGAAAPRHSAFFIHRASPSVSDGKSKESITLDRRCRSACP